MIGSTLRNAGICDFDVVSLDADTDAFVVPAPDGFWAVTVSGGDVGVDAVDAAYYVSCFDDASTAFDGIPADEVPRALRGRRGDRRGPGPRWSSWLYS